MIKPLKSLFLFTLAGLVLAGCSSTPERVNTGPISARTFSFINNPRPMPGYSEQRQAIHGMIQEAISTSMANKGVAKVASGGDITVCYLVVVGNNATTTSINDYFGYGDDIAGLQEKAHAAYTQNKNPNYFEAGTLIIDIVDAKSFKLLKRGHATRSLLKDLPADKRAARIQEVVNEILADVSIKS